MRIQIKGGKSRKIIKVSKVRSAYHKYLTSNWLIVSHSKTEIKPTKTYKQVPRSTTRPSHNQVTFHLHYSGPSIFPLKIQLPMVTVCDVTITVRG